MSNSKHSAAPRRTRDELEERVEELEEQVEELDQLKASIGGVEVLVKALTGAESDDKHRRPHHYIDDARALRERLESVEEKAEAAYDSGSSTEVAWREIVKAGKNLANVQSHCLSGNCVLLYKDNIAQATGRSERQASNYIERFGENKSCADWREHRRGKRRKALIIDLDRL